MKRYVSLAGAMVLGTVVAKDKKTSLKSALMEKKADLQALVSQPIALLKSAVNKVFADEVSIQSNDDKFSAHETTPGEVEVREESVTSKATSPAVQVESITSKATSPAVEKDSVTSADDSTTPAVENDSVTSADETTPAVENDSATSADDTTPAVENDSVTSADDETTPAVENDSVTSADDTTPAVEEYSLTSADDETTPAVEVYSITSVDSPAVEYSITSADTTPAVEADTSVNTFYDTPDVEGESVSSADDSVSPAVFDYDSPAVFDYESAETSFEVMDRYEYTPEEYDVMRKQSTMSAASLASYDIAVAANESFDSYYTAEDEEIMVRLERGYAGVCGVRYNFPVGDTYWCDDTQLNLRTHCVVQSANLHLCCVDTDGCQDLDDMKEWRF
jgi:hypothetical protein